MMTDDVMEIVGYDCNGIIVGCGERGADDWNVSVAGAQWKCRDQMEVEQGLRGAGAVKFKSNDGKHES
jgi:hypothetical protein